MKKVKIALWIIIFGFVGMVIGQNWEFFKTENSLLINLFVAQYETPLLANAVFFVAFFIIGVLVSYFFGLVRHYRDAKTIRVLKSKETTLVDAVSSLENQVNSLKRASEANSDGPVQSKSVDAVVEPAAEVK
jgi:uncharacterized membrane protein YciS (DUF1049 family)